MPASADQARALVADPCPSEPANQNDQSSPSPAPSIDRFFETIFGPGMDRSSIHVVTFGPEPGLGQAKWFGKRWNDTVFNPGFNNYFTIAPLKPGMGRTLGAVERHVLIVADDVGTKVDAEKLAERMGYRPTFKIETSPGNQTWGWKLDKPVDPSETDRVQLLAAIRDHMKHNGLTDPGTADPVRLIRLYVGTNTKEAYQNPFDGSFPSCGLVEWNPTSDVSLEALAARLLGADFWEVIKSGNFLAMANVRDGSGTADFSDPLIKLAAEIGMNPRRGSGAGKVDANCPNMAAHSQRPESGFAFLGGGIVKCQHGECGHLTVKDMHGLMYAEYERQVEDRRKPGALVDDGSGHLADLFTGEYVPATASSFVAHQVFTSNPIDVGQLSAVVAASSTAALARVGPPASFKPAPFRLRSSTSIQPRQWLYGNILIRGHVSLLVSPGGIGKSSLVLVEALSIVTNRALLGDKPDKPRRVMSANLEDPADELDRRAAAAAEHHGLTDADIGGRFFQISGRDVPIKIVRIGPNGAAGVQQSVVDWLVDLLRAQQIDVLMVDPFVGTHDAPENDNTAMNAAVAAWREVADRAQCAVLLVHHVSKAAALDGDAVGIYGSRGGGSLIDGVRSARFLVRMTKEEATRFGVREEDRWRYFRAQNGKSNLAPASTDTVWLRMASVPLNNGTAEYPDGDVVGVTETWTPPKPTDLMPSDALHRVQHAIKTASEPPRADERADGWVGYVVADVLGMDIGEPGGRKSARTEAQEAERAQVRVWIATWVKDKFLVREDAARPKDGRAVPIMIVGREAPDVTDNTHEKDTADDARVAA
ncbi:AAA family ATPase [Mesorhizobium sp. BR1-1-12]|uniref:AAA family ATPase n=1 Tax=unclassified Mesorhizobium TaxID=325217 RepID=UPI001CCD0671|nr:MULTISPECIES: AAA family ATPase [unclassified Mesorhizobium]MBZ9917112.1 AAA family ATPase [Mesorhizobium sp. BR1-1-7]MBZ9968276.1 AAA family ATPase [Mesorhizobium sp. BR1-1-12]